MLDLIFYFIFKRFIGIFKVIDKTNPATVVIGLVFILMTYLIRTQINERFKKQLPVPVPTEFIVVSSKKLDQARFMVPNAAPKFF